MIYLGKRILFVFILIFLLLPLIQQKLNIVHVKELHGVSTQKPAPVFSLKSYLEGDFQEIKEAYFNENFGFRNFCVRVNNQIAYTFFNEAKANDVIVGKSNYLYEEKYIKTYLGRDFIGEKNIQEKVRKLKMLQDTLKKMDIDLIVILAPGKGTFYPEFIPEKYFEKEPSISNYSFFVESFKIDRINFIDFNKWFLEMKTTTAYPIFPKTGIHWSRYGEVLAADSITKYIDSIRDIKMPKILIDKIELADKYKGEDNDIEKGMNLLFGIPNEKMAYPSYQIVADSTFAFPRVLTIGDSFYWDMYRLGFSEKLFNNGEFWYYNRKIYHNDPSTPETVADITPIIEVGKNDVIVLMATDANLSSFAFGFIDNLYDSYFKR